MRVLLSATFLGLACWFVLGSDRAPTGRGEAPVVPAGALSRAAPRTLKTDPRILDVGGQPLRCDDCHRLFDSANRPAGALAQHADIVLDHGLNDACLNCHDAEQRERLVLRGGGTVGLDQAAQLCAQCHGPTWRDHQRGIHGRSHGSWDPASPERSALGCTECHDPHAPAFPGLAPLPAPASTRGDDTHHAPSHPPASPLRRWRGGGTASVPAQVSAAAGDHDG